MKKRHISKEKAPVSKKKRNIVILIVVVAIFVILLLIINSGKQGTTEESDEGVPLEEVRGQASDAFLTNDESVDAADIEVGLG